MSTERKAIHPGQLPGAWSRLLGGYLGAFALAVTFLVGVLAELRPGTAIIRAMVVGLFFALGGRGIGWFIGLSMKPPSPSTMAMETEEAA